MELVETPVSCPYCGEIINVLLDDSIADQEYVEDCQVCCQPITFKVHIGEEGDVTVDVFSEDDTVTT